RPGMHQSENEEKETVSQLRQQRPAFMTCSPTPLGAPAVTRPDSDLLISANARVHRDHLTQPNE
ncbi:hypothetical protein DM02DRAFT_482626, partial [Periconia macrospinosa]